MLNDFVLKDGRLPVKEANDVIEKILKIKNQAKDKGIPVIYANDAHDPEDDEFKKWPKHAVKGEKSAEVIEELAPDKDDIVIEKQDLSMFTVPTTCDMLKSKDIDELYLTGIATEYCVKAAACTISDKYGKDIKGAIDRGFKVNVVVDTIKGIDLRPGDAAFALIEMGNAGVRPIYTEQALEELNESDYP